MIVQADCVETGISLQPYTYETTFLQRVRIARSAERCTIYRDSVCLSFRHIPVFRPDK